MRNCLNKTLSDESGAVTVDWVVLTAAVAALAVTAFTALQSNGGIGSSLSTELSTRTVGE